MSETDNIYRLGITLAGAVSAGAYSAGVLDFLREALDAWEEAKRQGIDSAGRKVPTHTVRVQALSGTSAGAMCAAMFVGSLGRSRPAQENPAPFAGSPLYDAWVRQVDILPMLDDADLVADDSLRALLNCRDLDRIGDETLQPWTLSPFTAHPWLAEDADLFLCTTSLRGIPYEVRAYANQAAAPYGMSLHAGVLRYRLQVHTDPAGITDAIPLATDSPAAHWDHLRNTALASGAFPLALRPRVVSTPRSMIAGRRWEVPDEAGRHFSTPGEIDARIPDGVEDFVSVCVDGGAINNEPVEYTRMSLALASPPKNDGTPDGGIRRLPRDLDKTQASTLLIDPFPDTVDFDKTYHPDGKDDLLSVITALVPALLDQASFKTDELVLAAKVGIGSRYLISPCRPNRAAGQPDLACGPLGGFLGFIHEGFRHHDYLLGRLNCQRFLFRHFYVDFRNSVVNDWSENPDLLHYTGSAYYGADHAAIVAEVHAAVPGTLPGFAPVPVIPLMPELRSLGAALGPGLNSIEAFQREKWATYDPARLPGLEERLSIRLDAVFSRGIDQLSVLLGGRKPVRRWLLGAIASLLGLNPARLLARKACIGLQELLTSAGLMKASGK